MNVSGEKVKLTARGKVNLALHVTGRLSSGLHVINSVICPITLADEIILELTDPDSDVQIECSFSEELEHHLASAALNSPPISEIMKGLQTSSNLAARAACQFLDYWRLRKKVGVIVKLVKRIPFEAGLGGGSADAAAVIRGLGRLMDKDERDPDALAIASALGADVPAQLIGEIIFAHGTGRDLIRLELADDSNWLTTYRDLGVVIVKPLSGVSTAGAYAGLGFIPGSAQTEHGWEGERSMINRLLVPFGLRIVGDNNLDKEDEKKLTLFQQEGSSAMPGFPSGAASLFSSFANDFERVVVNQNAEVKAAFELLKAAGATRVLLAGSGSAVLGFAPSHREALELAQLVRQRADSGWFITTTELDVNDVVAQPL
jgi:4-diphosphocytidyl-2C-methyl-D-erythritol kinase